VIPDNGARDGDGRWYLPASRNGSGQGRELAGLVTRQLGRGSGSGGSWSRFLVAHVRWIAAVTLVVVAGAALFAASQTRLYRSQAAVEVLPAAGAGGGVQQADLSTEEGVVTSGVVLGAAAQAIGVPEAVLASGVSATARGTSSVLQISYSNPDPGVAQQRAQAIAQAYTAYRAAPVAKSAVPSTAPTAKLITPASLPASPYSPDYAIDIGAAVLVGLVLALVTAWARDYLDDRLRGPFDLERQADADVLALIPAFRPGGSEPVRRLVMAVSPGSVVAEAYRGLRTRVLLAAAARNSRTVLVTSPAWEDRGTVAANLAAALAQSGRSTVLVCADLHWGSANLILGSWNDGHGLTELLERRTDLDSALHATTVRGLRLLPPGAAPPDPAALLQRPAWRAVLNQICTLADVVVIEAPPLLASADALSLADDAEMILLVADARSSTRAQVRAAARELGQERARLAGCAFTSVGRRRRLKTKMPGPTPSPAGAKKSWPPRAPLSTSNVSFESGSDTTLAVPRSDIAKEEQWPNGS